jgi:hypothetical protein
MLFTPTLPPIPYLTGRCQRFNIIGQHSLRERISGRVGQGLGIKSSIGCLLRPGASLSPHDPLGVPSRFAEGDWVRVRDQAAVRGTLDGGSRLRGLEFTAAQWTTCSKVHRVVKRVRRIIDDKGKMRPVSHTVLLSGIDCTGDGTAGCGRHCPMMYRDEWLDPADPQPEELVAPPGEARFARIRPLQQIPSRLDWLGQREGLMFMPEMARYAGTRARILRQLSQVFEYDCWRETPHPIYILDGLHCTGGILGSHGPCHRACRLLWHADWIELDA